MAPGAPRGQALTATLREESILVVEDLSRRFGDHEVIRRLNFVLQRGERAAVCGANGSGKSTVLRCIIGTVTPSSGRIQVQSHRAGSLEAAQCVGVSLSLERSFYLRLSGLENLLLFARLRGLDRANARRCVDELSEELELGTILCERADRCSTGMLQQLAIARALLTSPPVLLFDEPTRSLDQPAADRFWAAIARREATAILIATHNSADVDRCSKRIDLPS